MLERTALLLSLGSLVALLAPAAIQSGRQDREEDEDAAEQGELDLRELAGIAELDLVEAVHRALEAQPGAAVEAGLEGERDGEGVDVFYEVMIVGSDHTLHEVKLSPQDGRVLASGMEDDPEDLSELRGFELALRSSKRTLPQLAAAAAGLVKGEVLSAKLGLEGDDAQCDVRVVNGRYLVEVEVEGREGKIVDLELARARDDEEHEHAEREHEGHQGKGHQDEDDEDEEDDD